MHGFSASSWEAVEGAAPPVLCVSHPALRCHCATQSGRVKVAVRCRPPFGVELEPPEGGVVVDVEPGRGADKVALNVDAQARFTHTLSRTCAHFTVFLVFLS